MGRSWEAHRAAGLGRGTLGRRAADLCIAGPPDSNSRPGPFINRVEADNTIRLETSAPLSESSDWKRHSFTGECQKLQPLFQNVNDDNDQCLNTCIVGSNINASYVERPSVAAKRGEQGTFLVGVRQCLASGQQYSVALHVALPWPGTNGSAKWISRLVGYAKCGDY